MFSFYIRDQLMKKKFPPGRTGRGEMLGF